MFANSSSSSVEDRGFCASGTARIRSLGNETCPCRSVLKPFGIPSDRILQGVSVGVDGFTYDYPATYGVGGCAAHDALLPPYCKVVLPPGSMVQVELHKWCFMPWCYVIVRDWNAGSDQTLTQAEF